MNMNLGEGEYNLIHPQKEGRRDLDLIRQEHLIAVHREFYLAQQLEDLRMHYPEPVLIKQLTEDLENAKAARESLRVEYVKGKEELGEDLYVADLADDILGKGAFN